MSNEQNKHKIRSIDTNIKTTTVTIKPHPQEILDLDEETVSIARAKLAGFDFTEIYGDEDRSSPELMIRTQAQRIRELFRTPAELKTAFSSPKKIEEVHKDMMIDGIDLDFVKSYCFKRQMDFANDEEALLLVAFNSTNEADANV